MTNKFKKRVHEHAEKHGMSYQAAQQQLSAEQADVSVELPTWTHIPRKSFEDGLVLFTLPNCDEQEIEYMSAEIGRQLGEDPEKVSALVTNIEVDVAQLDRAEMREMGWAPVKEKGILAYKLPPPNDDTATEYVDEAFHAWVEYAQRLESGQPPPGKKGLKKIIVNGRAHETEATEITFMDIVKLAFDKIPSNVEGLSMTYRGANRMGSILMPGAQPVPLEDGMVFNAMFTGNA